MQALTRYIGNQEVSVSEKELLLVHEIGLNEVPTATDFVIHMAHKYEMSETGVWYTLKKLKKGGIVDFTERGEEQRPLSLTGLGMRLLRGGPVNQGRRQQYGYISNLAMGGR